MKLITALHHAALQVADLGEAFERWSRILGLHGQRFTDYALLRCTHEDFCLLLRPAAAKPGLEYVAYELIPGLTLAEAKAELGRREVAIQEVEIPGREQGLRLADPDGNAIVLLERRRPADPRPAEMIFSEVVPGFHPRRLGHVNYLTENVKRAEQWYVEKLGFAVTDWIGEEGLWLHVNAMHHSTAFLEKGFNHIHHLAFELVDWGEMRVALDHLGKNQRSLVWGPGRHGMARNLFGYFRMPEEDLFIELYCDMQQLEVDHQPVRHPDTPHSSNTWGILPPRTYFRFDEEAIRLEQAQALAYAMP
jgi:catechol-2,3-dioxygenase